MTMSISMLLRNFRPHQGPVLQASNRILLPALSNISKYAFSTDKTEVDHLDSLKSNPYFSKYASKLEHLQKTSPEELNSRIKSTRLHVTNKMERKVLDGERATDVKRRELEDIMRVDMVKEKPKEEIINLWHDYHEQKNLVSAVIPWDIYKTIYDRSKEYPVFLIPLPRENGYEFFVSHFHNYDCYFTQLINFQTYKENAPPAFILLHYVEFSENKGIVLVRGEVDKQTLSGSDARCLMQQLQLYYSDPEGGTKHSLLHSFRTKPDSFRYMDLVKEISTVDLERN